MCAFVRKILKEWNFEEYIQKFIDQEINEESFMALKENDVKDLIEKVGRRRDFMIKLEEWRKEKRPSTNPPAKIKNKTKSTPECQAGPSTSSNDYPNTANAQSTPINNARRHATHPRESTDGDIIRQYLSKTTKGKSILKQYGKSSWSDSDRNDLAALIINEETRIPPERLKELADLIQEAFPTESAKTYYVPYENNKTTGNITSQGGRLYRRYLESRLKFKK